MHFGKPTLLLDTLSKRDLQDLFRDVAQARQSALLLDYDGTLAGWG